MRQLVWSLQGCTQYKEQSDGRVALLHLPQSQVSVRCEGRIETSNNNYECDFMMWSRYVPRYRSELLDHHYEIEYI